ncbi:MAG TPA: hypothetical protein PLD30_04480 [Candidatus Competibacteraceae bacterium]|nr:hypothetical protein [Candidatus Competibacteraceae bacterium]
MTEHDDKQMARVDTVANVEPSKGRRRLVKGVLLATPAIVTLRTGFARPLSGPPTEEEALHSFCTNNGGGAGYASFMNANPGHPGFTEDDCNSG